MEEGRIVPLIIEGDEQIVRIPDPFRFDTAQVRVWREGARVIIEPMGRREWSPGFWERMQALAAESDLEVPERLPSSEHRYAIFDEDDLP